MTPNQTPPSPPLNFSDHNQKLDIESVHNLVSIITHSMHNILEHHQSLKHRCFSQLKIQSQDFFEFSEHSVLSNLYWGIHNILNFDDGRETKIEECERMLQIPASLDENGVTLGISNGYIVCASCFYLSILEFLRKNEWQSAIYFLQAVSVSPKLVCTEFAPGVCRSLYPLFLRQSDGESVPLDDDEVMRWIARRYKPWLMYYQIMSTTHFCAMNRVQRSRSNVVSHSSYDHQRNGLRTYSNPEKMHCLSFQESIVNDHVEEVCLNSCLPKLERRKNMVVQTAKTSNLKCLKDILTESEPDSPISLHSDTSSSVEEFFPQNHEEVFDQLERRGSLRIQREEAMERISRSFSTSYRDTNVSSLGLEALDQCTLLEDSIDEESEVVKHGYIGSISRMAKTLPSLQQKDSEFIERLISKLCFTEDLGNEDEDYTVEMKAIYELLESKSGIKYTLLKDVILDQLLKAITTSKEENVVRISVSILSTIVASNRSVIEDVKRKGLQLYDLATALKRNVHEAVILIYLIDPSPLEIKTLELLPCLVEVVCASKVKFTSFFLTPPSASLMMIEVLVSAFDYETNSMHLGLISSPRVMSSLLQVPRKDNLEEFVSLASILVKCMRFDGKCRKYVAEFCPVSPFVSLLLSNQKRATSVGLEFFNELLRMPRSSAIHLLDQIQKHGSINNMCALFLLTQNSEAEHKLLAANLLLQLEVLEDASAKCMYREEAVEALLESLICEESPQKQALSSFILSNLGGTFSWTGEPYTIAWLVKKTGLALQHHRNLIKTYDFLDLSLQDAGVDSWCGKIGQRILHLGTRVFDVLDKGLKSKSKRVSRDSLAATAWIGCELIKGSDELRNTACEMLLHTIEQFVHPGFELEERLLACLCIYNFTSGKGMKKIMNLSEGVRESLRRLSSVTWMAEELLKVADYFQPNKWRISCVHSQVLEAGNKRSGGVSCLIYYKGLLYSGYTDGSIKAWEIKGQTAALVHETKEHKKAVTCFTLYEPGNCLLSGSADKTIKKWQMLQRSLECIEVIPTKESIKSIESWNELIFVTTQTHKLKVIDASRKVRDVFKNKRVKCTRVLQGKVYAGCMDSSIQEMMIMNNRQQEIKAPSKSWMQTKPISAISTYKDWLYNANLVVEGSKTKDWRRGISPQMSIVPEKGASILAMEVVEDFIYLNCSTSMSSIQIWLRGTQHKVGRLSAGSKITCILSANDMILCGTEKGVIKGWIPL
ncbi:hypothetical protein ACS0TY_027852 [Phlomoides rotata]